MQGSTHGPERSLRVAPSVPAHDPPDKQTDGRNNISSPDPENCIGGIAPPPARSHLACLREGPVEMFRSGGSAEAGIRPADPSSAVPEPPAPAPDGTRPTGECIERQPPNCWSARFRNLPS